MRRSPLGVPSAFAPWQTAHFCAKTIAPCATEPEPAGKPLPSGGMLMSMRAISSGVAGRPNFGGGGAAAKAPVATTVSAAAMTRMRLDIDIAHLAVGGDAPALDGAEMEVLARRILRDPIGVRLLNDALLIR